MKKTMFNMVEKFAKFFVGFSVALFCAGNCFAADPGTIQDLVGGVQKNIMVPVLQGAISTSYLGGVIFALVGLHKFKAHKENPTQVPMSTPIVFLVIGVFLIFFPSVIRMTMGSLGFQGTNQGDAGSLAWTSNSVTTGAAN